MERGSEQNTSPERRYPQSGIYEHYKSTEQEPRYYQVLFCAQHTERDEELVVYIPLYRETDQRGLAPQVRPVEMFTETVRYNGALVPRFRFCDELR